MRAFDRLRTLLRDELGTAPSPDAIAAHDRLLHPAGQAPRPALAPRTRSGSQAIELPGELRARAAPPLVGRRDELGLLGEISSRMPVLIVLDDLHWRTGRRCCCYATSRGRRGRTGCGAGTARVSDR
jgi:hypothetical protein